MKSYMVNLTGMENPHAKFQVSGLSGSMFLYCKIMQDSDFFTFFERGSYKNQGIDMNFYRDKLGGGGRNMQNNV